MLPPSGNNDSPRSVKDMQGREEWTLILQQAPSDRAFFGVTPGSSLSPSTRLSRALRCIYGVSAPHSCGVSRCLLVFGSSLQNTGHLQSLTDVRELDASLPEPFSRHLKVSPPAHFHLVAKQGAVTT